jgi:hypothetical protein
MLRGRERASGGGRRLAPPPAGASLAHRRPRACRARRRRPPHAAAPAPNPAAWASAPQDAGCSLRSADLAGVNWAAVRGACASPAPTPAWCRSCICAVGEGLVMGLTGALGGRQGPGHDSGGVIEGASASRARPCRPARRPSAPPHARPRAPTPLRPPRSRGRAAHARLGDARPAAGHLHRHHRQRARHVGGLWRGRADDARHLRCEAARARACGGAARTARGLPAARPPLASPAAERARRCAFATRPLPTAQVPAVAGACAAELAAAQGAQRAGVAAAAGNASAPAAGAAAAPAKSAAGAPRAAAAAALGLGAATLAALLLA